MSTAPEPAPPAAVVIRRTAGAGPTRGDRVLKAQLPAIVVSGAVHVALVMALIVSDAVAPPKPVEVASEALLTVTPPDERDPAEVNLTNPDLGLDPDLPPAIEADNLGDVNVQAAVQATDAPGAQDAPQAPLTDLTAPAGVGSPADLGGALGAAGPSVAGGGGFGAGDFANPAFAGRGAATRSRLLAQNGGNSRSEAAVAKGMVWLAKQQKPNGSWVYDGSSRPDTPAATGLALLPFLAAGQTHKSTAKDNVYKANVEAGVKFLLGVQQKDGSFKNAENMYSHAIVTVALCELLGMTGDKKLESPVQAAVNYIVKAQAGNGSWGYQPGVQGDTSIVGWQIQALQAAKLCKGVVVNNAPFEKAAKFLDTVSSGPGRSKYGYTSPGGGNTTVMTAVGLLTRYYVEKWGPENPGMLNGVKYLTAAHPPTAARMDRYYYYYSTQVLHFFAGDEWDAWNGKMRDLLIDTQATGSMATAGTWEPDDRLMGGHCGRLGATCLSLLTLEVYYRHLSLNKRDTGGLKELQRGL